MSTSSLTSHVDDLQQVEANADHVPADEHSPPDGAVLVVAIHDEHLDGTGPRAVPYPKTFGMSRTAAETCAADLNRAYVVMHREGKIVDRWHVVCRPKKVGFVVAKVPVKRFQPRDEYDFPFHLAMRTNMHRIECRKAAERFNLEQIANGPQFWALQAHPIRRPEPVPTNDPRVITDTLLFEVEHLRRIAKEPAEAQNVGRLLDVIEGQLSHMSAVLAEAEQWNDNIGDGIEGRMLAVPIGDDNVFGFEYYTFVGEGEDGVLTRMPAIPSTQTVYECCGRRYRVDRDAEELILIPDGAGEMVSLRFDGGPRSGEEVEIEVIPGIDEWFDDDGNRFVIRRDLGVLLHSPVPVETEVSA